MFPCLERSRLTGLGWVILLWLASLSWATAQEVVLHLKNGDRVSGTIVNEDTNRVVVATPWAKEVIVPTSEIVKRDSAVSPEQPAPPPEAPAPAAPPPAAVKPKPPQRWFVDLQVGANILFSEKNQQVYSGRAKLTYTRDKFRNVLDYLVSYGRTDGEVSANRMDGTIKTDFDLGERLYVYNLAGAGYDQIRRVDVRYEAGPGLGYRLLRRDRFVANLEGGLNYQVQELEDNSTLDDFYLRLAEEATWTLSQRMTVDEKFEYFPSVERFGSYRFRFETNLRYLLANNVTLNFTLIDQYDTQRAQGVQRNDLQLRSSLGVKF